MGVVGVNYYQVVGDLFSYLLCQSSVCAQQIQIAGILVIAIFYSVVVGVVYYWEWGLVVSSQVSLSIVWQQQH